MEAAGLEERMALTTAQQVLNRAGIGNHPEYEDVELVTDYPGFYVFRRYPPNTPLTQVVTADGRPAVRCYLAFIIDASSRATSRVLLRAWLARRWRSGRVYSSSGDPYEVPEDHPDGPTPASAALLARTRLPIDLDHMDASFIYDHREDVFLAEDGTVMTPVQILDDLYLKHCRTLNLGFRIRWNLGSAARWIIRHAVWSTQDAAMWALLNFYDVELTEKEKTRNPFRKYHPADFRRITESDARSHFFGFQSSKKSLFTNLVVVSAGCALVYRGVPHVGLLRAVYNNTALSTAAVVFAFLLADTIVPWLLIRTICALSRVRDAVLFMIRKVHV